MSATIQKSYRLAPETIERIEQLAQLWSQVRGPLSAARVIDEAVKRISEGETASRLTAAETTHRNRSRRTDR